ncbi:hypothetical protein [Paenibacillus gansuensis]|uniref:Uncharacterized protein n=1 Tax=Paenibacillus gansuensis TaxID=306542 RepID=A0ABW5PCY0_9BACL
MAINRRLTTDSDFQEVLELQRMIRVFQDDHIVSSGGRVIRFTEETVVVQTDVSDVAYFERDACEFFELRKR